MTVAGGNRISRNSWGLRRLTNPLRLSKKPILSSADHAVPAVLNGEFLKAWHFICAFLG
jgi:hypothetical protein